MHADSPTSRAVSVIASVLLLAAAVLPSAQACAAAVTAGDAPPPVHHCDEAADSHAVPLHSDHDAPSSDSCESGVSCCVAHEAPADTPALRAIDVPTERTPALTVDSIRLAAPAASRESDALPQPSSAAAPRPVRLHLWTATFLS